MGKDSGTKCSHCGNHGHNSRTCTEKTTKTVKLFGVKISSSPHKREDPMKKSFSMGNLQALAMEHDEELEDNKDIDRGYLSDGPVRSKKDGHERKKGVPWTTEEHRTFLEGLKKLGKGDWRGISRIYVTTRTPAQVASHAQKYFLRQAAATKKKRRSSLFDMEINEPVVPAIANQVAALGMQSPSPSTPMLRTRSFPAFGGIPYMVGSPRGPMAVPVVNICNVGYGYQHKPLNNSGFGHNSYVSQPYMNMFSPPAAPKCTKPNSGSSVNTELKLGMAPADVGDRAKLPTHTSNMNGAIGVI
ncbi:hypothetical protein ACHQM5_007311 [Ranunculus cassubicifolius]